MKFKTVFKTVMFYGNVIYLNEEYNWLAVDEDGEIKAFMEKPFTGYGVWNTDSLGICALSPTMELEGYDWKDHPYLLQERPRMDDFSRCQAGYS